MISDQDSSEKLQDQYLTFKIAQEFYAFPVENVREVLEYRGITFIPRMPKYMRGIINLRGHVVPVLDLKSKFGIDETKDSLDTGIIVTEITRGEKTIVIGLLTDMVQEVIEISQTDIEPAPYTGSIVDTTFIKGMGKWKKDFIVILNLETILSSDEMKTVSEVHDHQEPI